MKPFFFVVFSTLCAGSAIAETPPPPPEFTVEAEYQPICGELEVTVYFTETEHEISPEARVALEAKVDEVSSCVVEHIRTTAVSNDHHHHGSLADISSARTDNVLEAIAATGIWANHVQSDVVLERASNRVDRFIEPVPNRVEVVLTTVLPISS